MRLVSGTCLTTLATLVHLTACSPPPPPAPAPEEPECDLGELVREGAAPAEDDLKLLACPLRRAVHPGDPVRVAVLLQNAAPLPQLVRARFEVGAFIFASVSGPGGEPVESVGWETRELGRRADFLLARHGLVGRVIGLDCDVHDYGALAVTWEGCEPLYPFTRPGTYRIRVSYEVFCDRSPCPPGFPWTGRVRAKPFDIEVLPDTVPLP